LIDLLSARSKNARFRVRNPWISLVGFLAAVAVIAWSYVTLVDNGLMQFDEGFWRATALMVAGTFLFFWSLAGFALAAIERTRGIYFKGLAMFTTRQIASKVNTAFVSLSVVCIMLFFSLTVFSTGMGLARAFSGNVEEGTLYDATLTANVYLNAGGIHDEEALASMSEEDREYQRVADEKAAAIAADAEAYDWDIAAKLADASPTWDALVDRSVQVDVYVDADESYGAIMDRYGKDTGNDKQNEAMHRQGISLVGVSQFNALADTWLAVDVGEDGYARTTRSTACRGAAEALAGKGDLSGRSHAASRAARRQPLEDAAFASSGAEAIVPDSVIADLRAQGVVPEQSVLNLMYKTSRTEGDKLLAQMLGEASPPSAEVAASGWKFGPKPWPVTLSFTAEEVVVQSSGMNMMISYLALYIGFVFLIATAAILAIQQLSETSDSLARYRVLAEIGCDRRMIFRSLRAQVLVYFLVPLALAVCHTVCAVGVISDAVLAQLGVSVLEPALMTGVLTGIVYGAYLLVTHFASRSIIRASLGKKLLG
ncbi:MAG: ABC transporter permease, partial [Eggerthella lenta]